MPILEKRVISILQGMATARTNIPGSDLANKLTNLGGRSPNPQ